MKNGFLTHPVIHKSWKISYFPHKSIPEVICIRVAGYTSEV